MYYITEVTLWYVKSACNSTFCSQCMLLDEWQSKWIGLPTVQFYCVLSLEGVRWIQWSSTPFAEKLPHIETLLRPRHLEREREGTSIGWLCWTKINSDYIAPGWERSGLSSYAGVLVGGLTFVAMTNLFQSSLLAQRPPFLNSTFCRSTG